ncbi:MAG TPA: transketolase C-terminal domain-containing protein [Bacteroidales bacterium]|nr:transketolase C-terminal domain-containing protein [Bacteroidales bacterium]
MYFENRGNRATKAGFGQGVLEAGKLHPELMVLGADITASVGLDLFAREFPDRFFSLGIAEQNCAGVAAGLALSGKIPVFSTYCVFAALRSADQIRVSLCYNNLHVIIGGAHAGLSVGPDGATHQALEDIAIMRALPKMTVLSPCDATQATLLTKMAVKDCKGPVYIRFGREAVPDFMPENIETTIGKGQLIKDGKDISIIATGHMVWEALQAAKMLEMKGVKARVINIHTIKPLDQEIIIEAARETKKIVTVEEHQVFGGFGSAVAEVVAQHCPVKMKIIGVQDTFGESGQPDELMEKYGLNAESIFKEAMLLMNDSQ